MSPTGLRNFIDGAEPYSSTRRKLTLWYTRSGHPADRNAASTALAVLVQDLPPAARQAAVKEILAVLEMWHQKRADQTPEWISKLMAEIDPAGPGG